MSVTVVETETYLERAMRLLSDNEREQLRAHLAANPDIYPVIPGTGGLRKVRWRQESRHKGKRGGVRVIYFYAFSARLIALLDIYSKDEKENLSDADKKALRKPVTESSAGSGRSMTPQGRRLLKGLKEVAHHLAGKASLPHHSYNVPDPIDVRAVRAKTGLSQSDFAERFAIGLRTLQDWEQGRRSPDATVRAYLTVIERNPKAVTRALAETT